MSRAGRNLRHSFKRPTLGLRPLLAACLLVASTVAAWSQPVISGGSVAADNLSVTVSFSEAVYTDTGMSGALTAADFSLAFVQNGGNATGASISSVTHIAGDASATVVIAVTGTASGTETVELTPFDGASIYNATDQAMLATATTGALGLHDLLAPAAFTAGAVTTTGGTVVAGYWNSTNAGVSVTIPIDNDSSLLGGSVQLQGSRDGSTWEALSSATAIGAVNTTIDLADSLLGVEGLAGFAEGDALSFRAVITDLAGNATTGAASATTLAVDQTAPTVSSIDTTTPDGSYNEPDPIVVRVNFSENVTLASGTLDATLDTTDVVAIAAFGPAATASGTYTIGAGDASADLTVTLLALNAATLRDAAGNDADLSLPAGNNLADNAAIVVDTTAPAGFTAGAVTTTGGTVVADYWNSTNAGVSVTIPIANDASLLGGTVQLQGSRDGSTWENLSAATAVAVVNTTIDLVDSLLGVESLSGFAEGDALSFRAIITDLAGNATTGSASGTTLLVDQSAPTMNPVAIVSDNADTSRAKIQDTVTLTFTSSESLIGLPTVTITSLARDATEASLGGNAYQAAYQLLPGDRTIAEAAIVFTIDYTDAAGNAGAQVTATTNASIVTFYRELNWGGSAGGDWHTAGNWLEGYVPEAADDVVIGTGYPVLSNPGLGEDVVVAAGAELHTGAFDLTIASIDLQGTARLERSGGTDVSATDTDSGTVAYTGAGAIQEYGGIDYVNLEIAAGATIGAGVSIGVAGNLAVVSGGSIVASGTGSITAGTGAALTGDGAISVADGDLTVASGGLSLGGSGAVQSSGAGSIIVNAGGLSWIGTAGSAITCSGAGDVTINGDLTQALGASGAIALAGGDFYVSGATDLYHAATPQIRSASGSLTFGGAVTLYAVSAIEGVGVQFDDALTLGGNLTVTAGTGNATFTGLVTITSYDLTVASSDVTILTAGISGGTGNVDVAATTRTDVDGTIALTGAGAVQLDRAIVSGASVTTVGGNITFDGAASIDTAAVAVQSGGGDVLFNNTLGLGRNLTVTAGAGTVTFTGSVTIATRNLTVASSGVTILTAGISGSTGNVDIAAATRTDVDGAIALTGAGTVQLDRAIVSGASVTTVGGDITFDGAASTDTAAVAVQSGGANVLFNSTLGLGSDLTVIAGAGTITITGAVSGAQALTLTSTGATAVAAIGTAATPLASLTVNDAGALTLNGSVYAELITVSPNVTLGASITVGDLVNDGANPDIDFAGTVGGAFDLTLTAAGETRFQGAVGPIGDGTGASLIQAGAGTVEFASTVTTAQGITQSGAGMITYHDNVTVNGSGTPSAYQNSVILDGLVYASAGDTTFGSDGTDALTLSTSDVTLGGAGAYTVNALTDGAVGLTLSGNGTKTFANGATIGGSIEPTGLTQAAGSGLLTLNESASINGNITLNGSLTATDMTLSGTGSIAIGDAAADLFTVSATGPVTIGGSPTSVTIAATTNLSNGLTISAGAGTITITGAVSGAQALTLTSTGATAVAAIGTAATPLASLTVNDAGALTLNGSVYAELIAVSPNVTLGASITVGDLVNDGANPDIDFAGTVGGAFDLTLTAAGETRFQGAVGLIGDGTGASLIQAGAGTVEFASTVTTAQGITQSGAGTITYRDNVTVNGSGTPSAYQNSVVLDGLVYASAGDTTFGSDGTDALTLSTSDVTLGGAGAYTVNALTDGAVGLTLSGNGTKTFANGATIGGSVEPTGLTQVAGSGLLTLNESASVAGNITLNGSLTATDMTLSGTGSIAIGDAAADLFTVSATGPVTIGGSPTSVTIAATTNLANGLTISAGAGTITITGAVSGAQALTLTSTGATAVAAIGTAVTPLASLTVNDTGALTLNGSVYAELIAVSPNVTLGASITVGDLVNGAANPDIDFAGTVGGAFDLTLTAAGETRFQGAVGPIGDGTGASLIQAGAGTVEFASTVTTAQGITQSGTGTITYRDNVTVNGSGTPSAYQNSVVLDGLVYASAGDTTFGSDGTDALTLSTSDVTLGGAGAYTVNAAVSGLFDLTLSGGGTKTFNAAVGLIGDNTGASLIQAGAGTVAFASTVTTAQGITQTGAGTITYRADVTVVGSATPSDYQNSVVLDGLVYASAGATTFGSDGTDALTLSAGDVTLGGAGAYTVNAAVSGLFDLTLSGGGTKSFNATVGLIGDNTGASLIQAGAGTVEFASTVTTAQGITQSGTGTITYHDNVTVNGSGTPSAYQNSVILDGLVYASAGATTFGSDASDALTLSTSDVTLGGAGAYTVNALTDGAVGLTLSGNGTKTFANGATIGGSIEPTGLTQAAGSGLLTLNESASVAGNITLNGSLTATDMTLSGTGSIAIGDAAADLFTVSATGPVTIGGSPTSVTIAAMTNLSNGLTISAGAGTITITGAVSGAQALTLTSTGATAVAAIGTAVTPLASLTVNDTGALTLNGSVYAELIAVSPNVTLGASITVGDLVNGAANPDIDFAGTVGGAFDLTLTAAGETRFQGAVGLIGDGAGASLVQAGAGTVEFASTVTTAQGITQSGAGTITYRDNVTVNGSGTPSAYQNSVVLDGLVYASAGDTTFGSDGTDALTLSTSDVTLGGAGAYTVNAAVSGLFDLTLSGGGTKTFNAAVGLIGDNTGASLIQAGAGTVAFASTVTTAQGITQTGAGTITYRADVTVNGSATPSDYQNSVVLDGLVYASAGATTFGSDGTDALTLSAGDVTLGGAGAYTVNAAVSGLFDLTLSGGGTKSFNATVGLIGDNTGASLIQAGAGTVEFASTVTTAQGITQSGTGTITYHDNVTVNGSGTPSAYQNSVILDGLVYASAGATTFGSDASDALTLSTSDVTLGGAGAYTVNALTDGAVGLTLSGNGTKTFADGATIGGSIEPTGLTQVAGSGLLTLNESASVAGNITLNGSLTATDMTLSGTGSIAIGDAAADLFTVSATGPVTIGGSPTSVTIAATTNLSNGLTISAGAGTITITGAVSGAQALTLTSTGATAVAAIGTAVTPLASLTVNDTGALTLNGSVYAELIAVSPNVTLGASITVGDLVNGAANPDIDFAGTVGGAFDLTLTAAGETRFQGAVGPIGDGTGASLIQAGAGTVEFASTVTTAQGITQSGAGTITYRDNVTVNGSGTPSAYQNSVIFDGLVYASAGNTTFGSDGTDALTLSAGDVTLGGAGAYTVNAAVSGLFDMTLSGGGTKTFNAAVGLIGDNTGASLIQAGAGTVAFVSTVTTAQGITQTGAGTITYRADVTVNGSATPSDYQNSVVLDGLVYASAGATTFGSDGTDALTLSGSMVSLAGAGAYIINASVGSNQHLVVRSTGNTTFNATVTLTAVDIYVDAAIATPTAITLNGDLSCRNFYYFRGNLEIANGVTLSTTRDFVAFGGTYSANDPDYDGADTRFAYWASTALAYVPGGGTAPVGVLAPSAFGAAFEDLGGAIITVDSDSNNVGNFYVNGANMTALAAWTLNLPAGTVSGPAYNAAAAVTAGQWGLPYAVAFNMTVSNSVAAGRSVAAAAASAGAPDGGTHHDVGGTSVGWNTDAPRIISVETVYDDVLRLTFDQAIENSNGEIDTLIVNALTNAGASAFAGAYTDPECTISTDTVDDIGTFYIQTSLTSWNTDATGTSPGAALSTDRDGNPRTTVPDLTMPLGLLRAAAGKAFVRNYGNTVAANTQPYDGLAGVGTFADECRPVLVSVEIGQDAIDHPASPDLQDEWNGRNYIQLRYSEPVVIGGLAVDAANVASMASFGAGEWGGALSGDRLEGYADFGGWSVTIAARTDSASGLDAAATPETVNGMYRDAPNAYGEHGLYVSVAGWSFLTNAIRFWPGYFPSTPTAPAGVVTVLGNVNITDAASIPNQLEPTVAEGYAKSAISVIQDSIDVDSDAGTADVVGWDVTPPAVAEALIGAGTGYFDVVPLATGTEIDSFELQFTEFMRDSSFYYANAIDGGMAAGIPGWSFRDADTETVFRYGATALDTQVISTAFTGAAVDVVDDGLLRMDPVPVNPLWTARSQLLFQYAQASALVTDAAGNLLPSYAPSLCAEKLPPKVRFVSAEVGSSRIYLQFTEPVWHDGTRAFVAADFSLSGTATSVSGVQLITPSGPVSELWLDLTEPVTTAFALDARIALGALVMDRGSNYADPSVLRRAVDVAVGPVTVLGASDGVHVGDQTTAEGALAAGALGLLRTFDGSGRLYDMDTTIFTSLDLSGSVSSSTALSMYYDVAPSDDYASTIGVTGRLDSLGPFWLPVYLSGFNLEADGEARLVSPFTTSADGLSRNFLVPASDPEVASGAEVGFLFRMGNLWIARNSTPGDPRQFDLWRYKVQDIVKQRGGVTILNNVIDSTSGERAAVQVDLARGGQVTVLVFTLDGDVVRSLHRGRLAAGSYTMTWDGTNAGGNPVARGIYFVRVVGPDIDEIRKVMVVKN